MINFVEHLKDSVMASIQNCAVKVNEILEDF
jgi:hypothetical protein